MNKLVAHPAHILMLFLLTILRQYHEFTMSHLFILERLSSAASCEWVHLSFVLGKDCLPFHVLGLCRPLRFGLNQFLLLTSCLFQQFIYHTFSPPITQILTLLHMLTSWVCDIACKYIHIHSLQSFFLSSSLTSKQVSWPGTLMSGTVSTFNEVSYFLGNKNWLFEHVFLQNV
jgi:hypothetical protein